MSSGSKINAILGQVYHRLEAHPTLKKDLEYVVSKKGSTAAVQRIFTFTGPDIDTFLLLQQNRDAWTVDPCRFTSILASPSISFCHPVSRAAWDCIVSEQHNAWGAMLRRCRCLVLSMLQKRYRMTLEDIVTQLKHGDVPYTEEVLDKKIKSLLEAGSKYEWLEEHLGRGVTFVLGTAISNDTWERRLPKKCEDNSSRDALQYLKSMGIKEMAAHYRLMRNSIISHMMTQLLQQVMTETFAWATARSMVFGEAEALEAEDQMWVQSLNIYPDPAQFNMNPQPLGPSW